MCCMDWEWGPRIYFWCTKYVLMHVLDLSSYSHSGKWMSGLFWNCTHIDLLSQLNGVDLRKLISEQQRSGSMSTQSAWAAAVKLLSATRAIWLEWSSDFLFPCMKTNSRGASVHCPRNHKAITAPYHLAQREQTKLKACLLPLSRPSLYCLRHEVVSQDFHPFSSIRQGFLGVSQRYTCFLLSPSNWRWIIYNSDGHVPAQVMGATPCSVNMLL